MQERNQEGAITKGYKEIWEAMNMFLSSIVMLSSWANSYGKIDQIATLNMCIGETPWALGAETEAQPFGRLKLSSHTECKAVAITPQQGRDSVTGVKCKKLVENASACLWVKALMCH